MRNDVDSDSAKLFKTRTGISGLDEVTSGGLPQGLAPTCPAALPAVR